MSQLWCAFMLRAPFLLVSEDADLSFKLKDALQVVPLQTVEQDEGIEGDGGISLTQAERSAAAFFGELLL